MAKTVPGTQTECTPPVSTNLDHSESGRVTKRRRTKSARKAKQPVKSSNACEAQETRTSPYPSIRIVNEAKAALRNSRARRVHQTIQRPGRGGLSAKGAEQLQQFFSKKTPESERTTLREMDETAVTVMLELAAEEVDCTGLSYEALMEVTEKLMLADRVENGRAEESKKDLKVEENLRMEEAEKDLKAEEDRGRIEAEKDLKAEEDMRMMEGEKDLKAEEDMSMMDSEKDVKVKEDMRMEEGLEVKEGRGSTGGGESLETTMESEAIGLWQVTCSHRYK